jgi:hypothetical protein
MIMESLPSPDFDDVFSHDLWSLDSKLAIDFRNASRHVQVARVCFTGNPDSNQEYKFNAVAA